MIDPIAIGEIKEYILKQEENCVNPTVWLLGAIDSVTKSKIASSMLKFEIVDGKPEVKKADNAELDSDFLIVQYGLKGFKNFGNAVFKAEKKKILGEDVEVASLDTIRSIPLLVIRELSDALWRENNVSEELEKN